MVFSVAVGTFFFLAWSHSRFFDLRASGKWHWTVLSTLHNVFHCLNTRCVYKSRTALGSCYSVRTKNCGMWTTVGEIKFAGLRGTLHQYRAALRWTQTKSNCCHARTYTHSLRETNRENSRQGTRSFFFRSDQRKCTFIWGKCVIVKYCSYKALHLNPSSMRDITETFSVCVVSWMPQQ